MTECRCIGISTMQGCPTHDTRDIEEMYPTIAEAQAWIMLLGRWPKPEIFERLTIIVVEYEPA